MSSIDEPSYFEIYLNNRRLFWLLLTISGSLITINTSEEILSVIINETEVLFAPFFIYTVSFFILNALVRYQDIIKIKNDKKRTFTFAMGAVIIEQVIIASFNVIGVLLIYEHIQKLISAFQGFLIINLPMSLGVTTVSSLTVEALKLRTLSLQKKIAENEKILIEYEKLRGERHLAISELDKILNDLKKERKKR